MAPPSERRWTRLAAALVLLELGASALDLWLGPFSRVHWEERFNARSGVMFACGHLGEAFELQYRTFCGGCTAEGLMAAPLFQTLGATHRVWKLVPELFHAVVLASGAWIAGRAGGGRAAVAFVALLAAAPGVYRELAHTGWGNHVEGPAFPLLATCLLLAAAGRAWPVQLAAGFAAGLLAGLGFWFAHLTAHLLPAVGLVALLAAPRSLPGLLAGAPLGLLPWWRYHQARPEAQEFAEGWMTALDLAPPGRWLDWVWGPGMRAGLWDPVDYGAVGLLPHLWWFAVWVPVGAGVWLAARRLRGDRSPAALAEAVGPVGLVTLLMAYWLRFDLWSNLPDPYGAPSFNLRYRVPLWPVMALCAAAPLGRLRGRRRDAWVVGLVLLCAFGLERRASLWSAPRDSFSGLRVYAHDGWSDDTVPLGQPPQARKEAQGRPQDLAAGLDWLAPHTDPLPECTWSHTFEVGRRLGVALLDDAPRPDRGPALGRAADLADDAVARRYLAFGIAKGLAPTGDLAALDLPVVLARLEASGLAAPVGQELGALARERHPVERDAEAQAALPPSVWAGLCRARGRFAVAEATRRGEVPPESLAARGGACGALVGPGIAAGWAQWVGCTEADERALTAALPDAGDPVAGAAYRAACAEHRER